MKLSFEAIGRNIQTARLAADLSQEQAAKMLDMSPLYYARVEQGARPISLQNLAEVAGVLNTSVSALLHDVFRLD